MEKESVMLMCEQAKLIIGPRENFYRCSLCGHTFPFCETVAAKEAMASLWVAFKDHVRTSHSEHVTNTTNPANDGSDT